MNSTGMIRQVKKNLSLRKKILLSAPRRFPFWHSRSGERTEFAEKITKGIPPKIHILKRDVTYWEEAARKFASRRWRYVVNLVYLDSDVYQPIMRCRYLHVQRARFGNDPGFIIVDGKSVPSDLIALNEGLNNEDLMEWSKKFGDKTFAIVHFTKFRY